MQAAQPISGPPRVARFPVPTSFARIYVAPMRTTRTLLTLGALGVGSALATRRLLRHLRHFDLRDRVAVVTGGSRGLGFAIARELLRRGARVAICARNEQQLRSAQDQLDTTGRLFTAVCDVTDPRSVAAFFNQIRRVLGPVDLLVNNAGTIALGPVEEQTDADYRDAMNTHFWGAHYCIDSVLPEMRAAGRGRIVNIASFGGKIATPHLIPYAASKFALVGYSESLRTELIHSGVYVTTVCPGLIRSGSPGNAMFKGRHHAEYAWFTAGDVTPIVSISPERLARQIVDAAVGGEPELISPWPENLQARLFGAFPGLATEITSLVAALLPSPGGIGTNRALGRNSRALIPKIAEARQQHAAHTHNEY